MSIIKEKSFNLLSEFKNNIEQNGQNNKFIFISTVNLTLKLLEKDVLNKSKIKISNKNDIIRKKINRLNKYYFDNKNKYNINSKILDNNLNVLINIGEFDSKDSKKRGLKLIKECKKEMKKIINECNIK